MGQAQQKKKDKNAKGSKAGRSRRKSERYKDFGAVKERARLKLSRILKSNGPKAAHKWAQDTDNMDVLGGMALYFGDIKVGRLAKQALA